MHDVFYLLYISERDRWPCDRTSQVVHCTQDRKHLQPYGLQSYEFVKSVPAYMTE